MIDLPPADGDDDHQAEQILQRNFPAWQFFPLLMQQFPEIKTDLLPVLITMQHGKIDFSVTEIKACLLHPDQPVFHRLQSSPQFKPKIRIDDDKIILLHYNLPLLCAQNPLA